MAATGLTTTTTDVLYCNAGLQECNVEIGLAFLDGEMQYLMFEHNQIKMKGYLKSYNSETGKISMVIDYYTGGGGDVYQGWTITTIDHVEKISNDYLTLLKNNNIILDGTIVSKNQDVNTAIAKAVFIIDDVAVEKYIVIYKVDGNMTWKFYNQADNISLYDYSPTGWNYPDFAKRIVAPIQMALEYPAFEVWFRLNGLPIVNDSGTLYCYCNVILPEHQALVDSLQGLITIEDRP